MPSSIPTPRERYAPKGEDRFGYSRAVRVASQVWYAGTTATDHQGQFAGPFPSVAVELGHILATLNRTLGHFDLLWSDVLDIVAYFTQERDYEAIVRHLRAVYPDANRHRLVEVKRLDDPWARVEVKIYAERGGGRRQRNERPFVLTRMHEQVVPPGGLCVGGSATSWAESEPRYTEQELNPENLQAHFAEAWRHLGEQLAAAGFAPEQIVDLVINTRSIDLFLEHVSALLRAALILMFSLMMREALVEILLLYTIKIR